VIYLSLLCYLVTLQTVQTFEAETESTGPTENVLSSFLHSGGTVHVVPDSEDVFNFTSHMNSIYSRENPNGTNLQFVFNKDESSLESAFQNGNVEIAIKFETTESGTHFGKYTIRVSPDGGYGLPPVATKKVGLETCRSSTSEVPEFPSTCPVNGYYYSNFLALQTLVDQAYIEVGFERKLFNYSQFYHNPLIVSNLCISSGKRIVLT